MAVPLTEEEDCLDVELPQLTPSNYFEWSMRMLGSLVLKNLGNYISEEVDLATDTNRKKDRCAMAQIRDHISLPVLASLKGAATAREVLVRLEAANRAATQARVPQIEHEFANLKLQTGRRSWCIAQEQRSYNWNCNWLV